jgi:subtilisin family serine protease
MKLFIFILLSCNLAFSKTIKVAVIDTGFDFDSSWKNQNLKNFGLTYPKFCKSKFLNFSSSSNFEEFEGNFRGHGTHIAGLIAKNNEKVDYCITIYKYYSNKDTNNIGYILKVYRDLLEKDYDIVNYSGGGESYIKEECEILKELYKRGTVIVAAAGNKGEDLDQHPFYPASCGPYIRVIGNINPDGSLYKNSNFYSSKHKNFYLRPGVEVTSLGVNDFILKHTGSSQATAIYTGELVREQASKNSSK